MLLFRLTILIALAIATPGFAQTGDFGRPKPSLLEGLIPKQFWQGPVTGYSWYPLTDLEQELRDRSYALIRPNEPRGNWNIYIAGFGIAHLLPPPMTYYDYTEYARMLLSTPARSEASSYNRVIEDTDRGRRAGPSLRRGRLRGRRHGRQARSAASPMWVNCRKTRSPTRSGASTRTEWSPPGCTAPCTGVSPPTATRSSGW